MSKHTPGPWNTVSDPCHWDTISTVVASGRMIVHVGGCCEPAEQEANARLIAAAPDLLEALEDLLYQARLSEHEGGWDFETSKTALAKAKGEV